MTPAPEAPRRPSRLDVLLRPRFLLLLGGATLIGCAPFMSAALAESVAGAFGCRLEESNPHPCLVHGHDLGHVLYGLFVAAYLTLVTWPLVLLAFPTWMLVGVLALIRLGRRARRLLGLR